MKVVTLMVGAKKVQGELLAVSAPEINPKYDVNIIKYKDGTSTYYSIYSHKINEDTYDAHDARLIYQLSPEMRKLV